MDGGKRGQVVKVCADPACRVHHPNMPSPQQVERERAEERKRIEKEKLAITTRHRILATILQRVSAPLKKADLLAVGHYLIGHLSYSQVPTLAKRHKIEAKKDSRPRRSFWPSKSAHMTRPNSASCFWKSACSTLPICVPAHPTIYSRMLPSVIAWMSKSWRRLWLLSLRRNAARAPNLRPRQKQSPSVNPVAERFGRSGSIHSAFFFVLYCLYVRSLGFLQNGAV